MNRGKRSILLDLNSEQGQKVFWRLVDTADVVVENNRKGGLARLGLTAGLLQSPYFLDYESFTRNEPEGLEVRGS